MGKQKDIRHKTIDDREFKYCGDCKEWLLLTRFGKSKRNRDGLCSRCKPCQKKYLYKENIMRKN